MSTEVLWELERREDYLHPCSLARSANWPGWVREMVGDTYGREALLRFHKANQYMCGQATGHTHNAQCGPRFIYLGMPFDPYKADTGETLIVPRPGRNTESGGHYYHVESRIPLVDDPEAAILRATINRYAFDWQPEVRAQKWSGWFEQLGRLWLMTHLDIITALDRYRRPGFVAVIDVRELPGSARVVVDAHYHQVYVYIDQLRPVFLLPVVGPVDLSPYTIVINKPGANRALASEIYGRACAGLAEARDYYRDIAPLVPLNADRCWPIPLTGG